MQARELVPVAAMTAAIDAVTIVVNRSSITSESDTYLEVYHGIFGI